MTGLIKKVLEKKYGKENLIETGRLSSKYMYVVCKTICFNKYHLCILTVGDKLQDIKIQYDNVYPEYEDLQLELFMFRDCLMGLPKIKINNNNIERLESGKLDTRYSYYIYKLKQLNSTLYKYVILDGIGKEIAAVDAVPTYDFIFDMLSIDSDELTVLSNLKLDILCNKILLDIDVQYKEGFKDFVLGEDLILGESLLGKIVCKIKIFDKVYVAIELFEGDYILLEKHLGSYGSYRDRYKTKTELIMVLADSLNQMVRPLKTFNPSCFTKNVGLSGFDGLDDLDGLVDDLDDLDDIEDIEDIEDLVDLVDFEGSEFF